MIVVLIKPDAIDPAVGRDYAMAVDHISRLSYWT
jgi:hypothetical protein